MEVDDRGKEFGDPVDRMTGNTLEVDSQIFSRIKFLHSYRLDQAVNGCISLSNNILTGEHPAARTDGLRRGGALGCIVTDLASDVTGIADQCVPKRQGITKGPGQTAFARHPEQGVFEAVFFVSASCFRLRS